MKSFFRHFLLLYLFPFLFPVTLLAFFIGDVYYPLDGFLLLLAALLFPFYFLIAGPAVLFYEFLLQTFPPAQQEAFSFTAHFDPLIFTLELFFGWILFSFNFRLVDWIFRDVKKNRVALYVLGSVHLSVIAYLLWNL